MVDLLVEVVGFVHVFPPLFLPHQSHDLKNMSSENEIKEQPLICDAMILLFSYLELSSRSNVGTSSSCLVTMPNEALTATESELLRLKPTSLIRWFPRRPFRVTSDLSS